MTEDKHQNDSLSAIIKQNAQLTELFSHIPAMIFTKDAQTGEYLSCNQSFARHAGKDQPEDVIGLTDKEIFDEEIAAFFTANDRITLSKDTPHTFIDDVTEPSGELKHFQTTKTKFVSSSGKLCILGFCVDITEMTNAKATEIKEQERERRLSLQEQLEEEEKSRDELEKMITALAADYRAVYHIDLDHDDGICYRADPDDHEQTAAGIHFPFLERFTWYGNNSVAPSYREGFLDFIQPEHIKEGLEKRKVISYRYLAQRVGREYYEIIRIARIPYEDDDTVHSASLGLSIIDKQMREAMAKNNTLSEALTAAQNANRAKTAFLSSMSHEIRTPMNAIIGLDTLALHNDTLPDETKEYLLKIGESANHLLSLINDILDMSRIESGRIVVRKEEFSLRSMLEQINTLVMAQCEEKGLKYECSLTGGVSDYYIGDELRLKQVLINILSNAIKFTNAPGSVTLTVDRTAVYDDQSTLKFSVKDTGVGMDKSFIPHIFETFTQEDSGRKNKYGSTGLGMAITKNIVDILNGTISVESEKGVGTEFTVVLTLQNSDHLDSATHYVNPKEMLVLIVDGDAVSAEHTRLILHSAGVKADIAPTGRKALRMLKVQQKKHRPYCLVLLDRDMPYHEGIEIAEHIRRRYDKETTVIIMVSNNWDDIRDRAVKAGVDSFLTKPLFVSNILDEFERIARKNKMNLFREKQRADLADKRILLAEDIQINAEIIKELLSLQDVSITHAENGRLALEAFEKSDVGYYDAILMDVRMPEMDGLEAAAAIRALDKEDAKTIPIIAMTANAFDEDVQRSLQVGMNAHLSKPVEPERLYRTLSELIWEAQHQQ